MKLSERLLKLDQRTGFKPVAYDMKSRWEQQVKLWWFVPTLYLPTVLVSAITFGETADPPFAKIDWPFVVLFLLGGFSVFMSGFLYNERLRHLGKKSSIPVLRDPDPNGDLKGKV